MFRNLRGFRHSLSMSEFILVIFCSTFTLFALLFSGCSPDNQFNPGGINYENNKNTEESQSINDDFETRVDPETLPSREPNPCPNLDSQLYQLTQSQEPLSMAAQMGLRAKSGKVQVLFVLTNEDADFLKDYEVELGTQSGNQIQGYVPIALLCELANNKNVLAIRPIDRIY